MKKSDRHSDQQAFWSIALHLYRGSFRSRCGCRCLQLRLHYPWLFVSVTRWHQWPLHSALVSVLAKRDKSASAPLVETITTPVSGVLLLVTIGVRLDLDNEPQPDAVLMIEEQAGGQARLSEDDYIEGAPELVAEIAASSAAIDLGDKKRAYRRNGIREYIARASV